MAVAVARPHMPREDPIANVRTGQIGSATWERYLENQALGVESLRLAITGNLSTWLSDTHAQRLAAYPPSNYDAGATFYESDRGVVLRNSGTAWQYAIGEMRTTLGNEPTDLGADDAGFRLLVTDYRHRIYWDGSAWQWADGDLPGRLAHFTADPGDGWGVLDGSTYDLLTVGATLSTTSLVTPNATGAYLRTGAWTGAPVSASGSTGTGNTGTGTTGTGTTGGATVTSATADASFTLVVAAGPDESVTSIVHDHSVTIPGLSIPGLSVPSLSVPGLGVGTLQMRHVAAALYVRL
jgi:hypothetical protein